MDLITALTEERNQLEREIADMNQKRKRLALINDLLRSYDPESKRELGTIRRRALEMQPASDENALYANMGPTDAIMAVLAAHKEKFLTPSEIKEKLIRGGFHTLSPNLSTMIYATCNRKSLADGELEWMDKGGTKAFRLR